MLVKIEAVSGLILKRNGVSVSSYRAMVRGGSCHVGASLNVVIFQLSRLGTYRSLSLSLVCLNCIVCLIFGFRASNHTRYHWLDVGADAFSAVENMSELLCEKVVDGNA